MGNANLAVAERFTQAVYAGDQETLSALLDKDFVLKQDGALPYGGTYRGAEGFMAFLQAFSQAFEVESLEKTATFVLADNPDLVVFEFSFRGKLTTSGLAFNSTLLERWAFRRGRIVSITPHWFEVPGA